MRESIMAFHRIFRNVLPSIPTSMPGRTPTLRCEAPPCMAVNPVVHRFAADLRRPLSLPPRSSAIPSFRERRSRSSGATCTGIVARGAPWRLHPGGKTTSVPLFWTSSAIPSVSCAPSARTASPSRPSIGGKACVQPATLPAVAAIRAEEHSNHGPDASWFFASFCEAAPASSNGPGPVHVQLDASRSRHGAPVRRILLSQVLN